MYRFFRIMQMGKKAPIVSEGFYPKAAIIDPELTYTMPPAVTAGTGIDVLSHAIEGYWSKGHQPICDTLAIHAAALVFKYLYRAYKNPSDEEARAKNVRGICHCRAGIHTS